MGAKVQPHIKVIRDGPLMHVIPYASNGISKLRLPSVTVDWTDREAARQEVVEHLEEMRRLHGRQGK